MKSILQELLRSHQENQAPTPEINNRLCIEAISPTNKRCYKCQKMGHIAANCRSTNFQPRDNRGRYTTTQTTNDIECYRCHRKGHIASNCRARPQNPSVNYHPENKTHNKGVECYRCHRRGHYATDCRVQLEAPYNRYSVPKNE